MSKRTPAHVADNGGISSETTATRTSSPDPGSAEGIAANAAQSAKTKRKRRETTCRLEVIRDDADGDAAVKDATIVADLIAGQKEAAKLPDQTRFRIIRVLFEGTVKVETVSRATIV